jgi:hypothetical protein
MLRRGAIMHDYAFDFLKKLGANNGLFFFFVNN